MNQYQIIQVLQVDVNSDDIVNIKDVMLIMSGNANSSIINSCNFSNSNSFIPGLELANYIVGQNSGNTIIGFAHFLDSIAFKGQDYCKL